MILANINESWGKGWAVIRARWYLRQADSVGSRVRLRGKLSVRNWGQIIIGDRVRFDATIATTELVADGGRLEIGDRTYINYGCSFGATELIRIGPDCTIGTYVIVMDNDFHRLEPERRLERPESAPIILEENVWLGARVIILRGVTIGQGSVVGAGSVVTKDIPPRSLAVGVPAQVVRKL